MEINANEVLERLVHKAAGQIAQHLKNEAVLEAQVAILEARLQAVQNESGTADANPSTLGGS